MVSSDKGFMTVSIYCLYTLMTTVLLYTRTQMSIFFIFYLPSFFLKLEVYKLLQVGCHKLVDNEHYHYTHYTHEP